MLRVLYDENFTESNHRQIKKIGKRQDTTETINQNIISCLLSLENFPNKIQNMKILYYREYGGRFLIYL